MTAPTRTTCPFCLNGCESGVTFDGYQYRMAYFPDAKVNKGRLCPRGNSANIVIDHAERLCRPLMDGRDTTWDEAERLVRQWKAAVKPDGLALVYSRGRAPDEVRRLHGLARELGTPNLVCGHIEPENAFNHRLEGVADASLRNLETAKAMLLVGDVFGTSPVASWRMVDARYADRKNRLVVVDSIRTRQSGFAHAFLHVRPGTEPFALLALAALIDSSLVRGTDVQRHAEVAGVRTDQLNAAAAMLRSDTPGFVGSAMHTGRVQSPLLHSLTSQLVARAAKKPFMGFRETALPPGTMSFADLRRAVAAGRIRMLFWTGGLFPYSYAQLMPELEKVEFRVATAIFRPDPPVRGLVLPLTAELERASNGGSYWGPIERLPLASPLDGTRTFSDVVGWFGRADEAAPTALKPVGVEAVMSSVARFSGPGVSDGILLLGQKSAIGLRGIHDREDVVWLNPVDAAGVVAADSNYVWLASSSSRREFRVHLTDAVQAGTASVGTNVHSNRTLFPLAVDAASGEVTVPPVSVALERSDRVFVQGGENPTVWL